MTLREPGESQEIKDAKKKLRYAVIELLQKGGSYNDIEDSISDAIIVQYNDYVYCDIITKGGK